MENGKARRFCDPGGSEALPLLRTTAADPGGILEKSRGTAPAKPVCMEKSRDLRVRGFQFTVAIVRFCRTDISSDPIFRRVGFQLVDAAGSVGANLEESGAGQSKPDFIAKQFVALKEARESRFWLRVIAEADRKPSPHPESIGNHCDGDRQYQNGEIQPRPW